MRVWPDNLDKFFVMVFILTLAMDIGEWINKFRK